MPDLRINTRACRGGEPFPSPARVERAMRGPARGLLAMIATLPDTEEYAASLPLEVLVGLRAAWKTNSGWRCDRAHHADLRSHGLADVKEPFLTVFGADVRAVVMRSDG